jgi:hypothetical protein
MRRSKQYLEALLAIPEKDRVEDIAAEVGASLATARIIDRARSALGSFVSTKSTAERQRRMVELMCSGNRVSLARAWGLAGYSRHHRPSLDSFLASAPVLALFKEMVLKDRPLPNAYRDRILAAIGISPTELQELREIGVIGKAK